MPSRSSGTSSLKNVKIRIQQCNHYVRYTLVFFTQFVVWSLKIRDGPRHVGTPGSLIRSNKLKLGAPGRPVIVRPFKATFFYLFQPGTGLAKIFGGGDAQIADIIIG